MKLEDGYVRLNKNYSMLTDNMNLIWLIHILKVV